MKRSDLTSIFHFLCFTILLQYAKILSAEMKSTLRNTPKKMTFLALGSTQLQKRKNTVYHLPKDFGALHALSEKSITNIETLTVNGIGTLNEQWQSHSYSYQTGSSLPYSLRPSKNLTKAPEFSEISDPLLHDIPHGYLSVSHCKYDISFLEWQFQQACLQDTKLTELTPITMIDISSLIGKLYPNQQERSVWHALSQHYDAHHDINHGPQLHKNRARIQLETLMKVFFSLVNLKASEIRKYNLLDEDLLQRDYFKHIAILGKKSGFFRSTFQTNEKNPQVYRLDKSK